MRSMATLNNELYGGFNTEVYKLEDGLADISAGLAHVKGTCKQASNSLVAPDRPLDGRIKQVTCIRPFVRVGGDVSLSITVQADFRDLSIGSSNLRTLTPLSESWENFNQSWEDWNLPWGSGIGIAKNNMATSAIGETFSIVLEGDIDEAFTWYSTDVIYNLGGIK